jgi:hypothetical protein
MRSLTTLVLMLLALVAPAIAGENLKLNPKLDYSSDSQDGPLIMGDSMDAGFVPGKTAYTSSYTEKAALTRSGKRGAQSACTKSSRGVCNL